MLGNKWNGLRLEIRSRTSKENLNQRTFGNKNQGIEDMIEDMDTWVKENVKSNMLLMQNIQ